jgi:hypothetical protein
VSGVKYGEREAELRRFKPYPAYKDSGTEWLGEIPAHWSVKPMGVRTPAYTAGGGVPLDVENAGARAFRLTRWSVTE